VPSALLAIGQDQPDRFVDRSRVSVDFNEPGAPGTSTDEDGLAWWSRGVYYAGPMRPKTNEMIAKWRLPEGLGEDMAWIANVPVPGGHANDLLSVFFEGMALTRANLYTYRDSGAMLSSVQGFRPGQMGPQMSAWQVSIDNDVSVFGTYPAARDSHNGPNWWTGNAVNPFVVQKESAALVVYGPSPIGAQALAFGHRTHLWFPTAATDFTGDKAAEGFEPAGPGKFDAVRFERVHWSNDLDGSVWMFGMKNTPGGEAYVGIYSAQPCELVTTGTWRGKEVVCQGLRNAFVVQVGSQRTFGSFDRFVDLCRRARIFVGAGIRSPANPLVDMLVNFDSPDPVMAKTPGGHRLQLDYGSREVRYGNTPFDIYNFPRFENPYTRTPWGATQYTIAHGGLTLRHDIDRSVREGNGVRQRPFEGTFDMTFWSLHSLYGIRPDGTLVWFGHMMGDDRNPPKDDGLVSGRLRDRPLAEARSGALVRSQPAQGSGTARTSPADARASTSVSGVARTRGVGTARDAAASTTADVANTTAATAPRGTSRVGSTTIDPRLHNRWIQEPVQETPRKWKHVWDGPKVVGTGWQVFGDVTPGGVFSVTTNASGAVFYGVTPEGVLKWYRHDGYVQGEPRWLGPVTVSSGWNAFAKIVAGGDGVLYGIGRDGSLRWYRHNDAVVPGSTPSWTVPQVVGQNWGQFGTVFSTGQGVLYGIDADGGLWWSRHKGYLNGANDWDNMRRIGTGWSQFRQVLSPGNGFIYAITPGGALYWYEHVGYLDGTARWRGPNYLGPVSWKDFTHVFPAMLGTPSAPVVR
jgi:hypothetical protein